MQPLRTIVPIVIWINLFVCGVSCTNSERDDDVETLTAREVALAYHQFDDVLRETHRFAMRDHRLNPPGYDVYNSSCIKSASLSGTDPIFPLRLTLNFGDTQQKCDDGFVRAGVITASFSGMYLTTGTSVSVSFNDYKKDNFLVSGNCTLTNFGLDSNGYMSFYWSVRDGEITGLNTNIQWDGTHTRTWVEGRSSSSQGNVSDDVFWVSGVSNGRNSRGNSFVNEITSDYVADYSCQWYMSGRSELTIPNLNPRTLNYDTDGTCNNMLYERRNNTYFLVEIPY